MGTNAEQEAQKYRDIIGCATLLYAFTEKARRDLMNRLRSGAIPQDDVDRELKKLVQLTDSDPPTLFLNRFVAASSAWSGTDGQGFGTEGVRLYRGEQHVHGYRWAKELLAMVDSVRETEETGPPTRFLDLHPEDLVAVLEHLRRQPRYASPADWKAFLYQVKLFLFTRYPRLIQA